MVRGGRASVAGVLQLGASAGRRRFHAQRRGNRIGTGTGGPPRSTFRRTLLCPTSLGPLGGRRAVRGDHPPDARRVHPEPHYLCRICCASGARWRKTSTSSSVSNRSEERRVGK